MLEDRQQSRDVAPRLLDSSGHLRNSLVGVSLLPEAAAVCGSAFFETQYLDPFGSSLAGAGPAHLVHIEMDDLVQQAGSLAKALGESVPRPLAIVLDSPLPLAFGLRARSVAVAPV